MPKKMSETYSYVKSWHFLSMLRAWWKCKIYKESNCIVTMIVGLLCKEEAACCPRGPGRWKWAQEGQGQCSCIQWWIRWCKSWLYCQSWWKMDGQIWNRLPDWQRFFWSGKTELFLFAEWSKFVTNNQARVFIVFDT